jgi:hypothetical protein
MKLQLRYIALASFACALAGGLALAQQKTMGEKWRTKMSMESEGFSMPARTMEVCVPQGKPEEALMQQDNGNCSMSNMKTVGNKTSADIKCTGKDAMSGHWEMEKLSASSARGTMDAKTAEMSMKMKYEYTRLGEACEVKIVTPPPVAQAPVVPQVDVCQALYDSSNEGDLPNLADALLRQQPQANGQLGNCTKHAVFKKFCATVQTPKGFSELEFEEIHAREQAAQYGRPKTGDPATEAAFAEQMKVRQAPLTESMKACGLGGDEAAVAKLQAKVLPIAVTENRWGFLLHYASDTWYPQLVTTAKAECSGRSFTNAANTKYLGLCRSYGAALVRDNRAGVLAAAGCTKERENPARGICIGATVAGKDATGAPQFADEARSGGSASPQGDAAPDEKKGTKDKAKDALDKGKKALRGLFGG